MDKKTKSKIWEIITNRYGFAFDGYILKVWVDDEECDDKWHIVGSFKNRTDAMLELLHWAKVYEKSHLKVTEPSHMSYGLIAGIDNGKIYFN